MNERSRRAFADGLNSEEVKTKIEALLKEDILSALVISNEIKTIIFSNAGSRGLKSKSLHLKEIISAPWFDVECEHSKTNLKELAKIIRKEPKNVINRDELFKQKRAFKAFMKFKTKMGSSFRTNIAITLKLVDALIKPILLYPSDF